MINQTATNSDITTENPKIDIASCKTPDELNAVLSQIAANANKSVAHALKAQIQVIKYISSPELYGSAFDLFFKHIREAVKHADEDGEYEIKDHASLMLNNLVFFMYAKIKWECDVNRSEGEKLLIDATNDLSESIYSLCNISKSGLPDAKGPEVIDSLKKVFFTPDKSGDNLIAKIERWLFKVRRTNEKMDTFYDSLYLLSKKLISNFDVIGKNDLIKGIYENYYDGLIQHHSAAWLLYEFNADKNKENAWKKPCHIIIIGGVLGTLVWFIRLICHGLMSLVSAETNQLWARTQWMWTGIVLFGLSAIISIICIIKWLVNSKKAKDIRAVYHEYYDNIIELFSENPDRSISH